MSIHHERVQSTLQRAIQQVIVRGLQDPRTEGALMTVLAVELSPDGHHAAVRVSVLPESHESKCIGALKHASAYIRREAGELVDMRALPQLDFVLDRSLKKQAGVIGVLGKLAQDREHSGSGPGDVPSTEQTHGGGPGSSKDQ
jgi:ribosome-binding factor A